MAESRQRKRNLEEEEEEAPSRPVLTNAEKMQNYRLRKKLARVKPDSDSDAASATVDLGVDRCVIREPIPGKSTDPVMLIRAKPDASVSREPIPGRSTDPIMFEEFAQDTIALLFRATNNQMVLFRTPKEFERVIFIFLYCEIKSNTH